MTILVSNYPRNLIIDQYIYRRGSPRSCSASWQGAPLSRKRPRPLCPALLAWSTMGSTALTQTPAAPLRFDASCHSGRLRYANARDLPSFPSSGLKNNGAAASAAASLGWANTKPVQTWTPAGLHTDDSTGKMASGAQSRRSTAGSQAAALAIGSANAQQQQRRQQSQSESASWGSSAAAIAFNKTAASDAQVPPDLARQGSMHAAKGAMAVVRPRAKSSPTPKESYPDQANAASNALSAATIAHRPSMRSSNIPVEEAGAIPFTNMDRQMFTSHPPVKPEVDEQRRNDVIHASAVAMAKKMYNQQQSVINTDRAARHARSSSFTRHRTAEGTIEDDEQPVGFGNLQEAAYKLAQQRLAKLQDEHQKTRGLEEYYGASTQPQRTKFGTIRNKLARRRSASDGALVEDKRRSMQIRKQMSLFDTKLAEVDEQKRARDREALLAAAQRNVQARLKTMDEKIQEETGWVAPPRDDWQWKARAAAQARFEASRLEDERKVDVGGGKVMDREAVEAIAAKRVQPLLDEINEKAERERERKAQLKAEEDKRKKEAERDKIREREVQEIHKKIKEQQKDSEKARKAEIRQEEKARKEDERAIRLEQKRMAKDTKQKGKEALPAVDTPVVESVQKRQQAENTETPSTNKRHSRALSINFPKRISKQKSSKDLADRSPPTGGEPSFSPAHKVKSWLKNHFPRPRSHSSPTAVNENNKKKFIGGAALARVAGQNGSSSSVDDRRSASVREVAMAGKEGSSRIRSPIPGGDGPRDGSSAAAAAAPNLNGVRIPSMEGRDDDSTSLDTRSVSSLSSGDRFEEARTTLSEVPVTPPPPRFVMAGGETGRASPVRGSRFSELLE
ncbi:hypothetical protein B0T16DRAFT_405772 [Cercophora newfieldiana]|uniref:Eisosome protein 1 n=1 Tax=Cercophora newfieldiana TaxID=92897 RepID=A0AA39YGJ7_9PEZI|nr:hypothetical protein B0T16DRAFT_405772 [Cercophora newfieldiana]